MGVNQRSVNVTQVEHQRPESPTLTLTWHVCKYKVQKLYQRYILSPSLISLMVSVDVKHHVCLLASPYQMKSSTNQTCVQERKKNPQPTHPNTHVLVKADVLRTTPTKVSKHMLLNVR